MGSLRVITVIGSSSPSMAMAFWSAVSERTSVLTVSCSSAKRRDPSGVRAGKALGNIGVTPSTRPS